MPRESHVAETLLGSPGDMSRLSQRVIRVGAAAAWFCVLLFGLIGLLTGDQSFYMQAIGPVLCAGLFTLQIVTHREHAGWALLGTAIIVVAVYSLVGDDTTLVAAALGVVVIASIAMLFVTSRHLPLTIVIGLAMLAVPFVWAIPTSEAVPLGAIMSVSFAFTSAIFYMVRNAATELNRRYQVMFEQSPTAAVELDWVRAMDYIESEFSGRSTRIRGFLGAYPEITRKAAGLVKVVRANRAAHELLDVPPGELLHVDAKLLTSGWIGAFMEVLVALVEGREYVEHEIHVTTFSGRKIWLSLRGVNVSSGDQPDGVLVALGDVTHLKAKEDAMAELIRSKDEFVASISHELRTPLTAVVGLTSEMVDGGLGGVERDELIELVASQAQEMSYIIDDLLVAARAEMGTVAVALSAIDLTKELAAATKGVGIHLEETPDTLPLAIGDGPRIRQVLRNLLTNLERYGGSRRRVLGGVHRGMVWLEIRDNGEGVAERDANRIFEPYASAHTGVSSSVGLGLSVSRRLAELMGGGLSYRRDGEESVFRLELALAEESLFV